MMQNKEIDEQIEKRIYKIIDQSTIAIICGFCEGKSLFPSTAFQDSIELGECHVCNGKGIVLLPATEDNLMICKYCEGNGQSISVDSYLFEGDTCTVCSGIGIVLINEIKKGLYEDIWKYLHPKVIKIDKKKFNDGYYADAVESCLKEYNEQIKKTVYNKTRQEYDGADLMRKAFSIANPIIHLTSLANSTDRNIQQGYMDISAGAMTGIRNPKAHSNITITPERAIHHLFLCSLLFNILENQTENKVNITHNSKE